MKILRGFILTFCTLVAIAVRAQVTDPGWFAVPDGDGLSSITVDDSAMATNPPDVSQYNLLSQPSGTAEQNTTDIQALADSLQDDPVRIYKYVHDNIRQVFYFGSKKGAQLTLLEKSGNDFDQCALLVALLRAAGYTGNFGADNSVGYQFGWMSIPFDASDHNDLHHWLQLNFYNTNWTNTLNYLSQILGGRGYPGANLVPSGYSKISSTNGLIFQRVWVILNTGGIQYRLDPAFKISEPIAGISLTNAMGFTTNALLNAAQGTDSGNGITGLNETAMRGALNSYAGSLFTNLQNNFPDASMEEILSGQYIIPFTNSTLPQNLQFDTWTIPSWGAVSSTFSWANIPGSYMSTLTVTFAGINTLFSLPQLQGQRLSLVFDANAHADLYLDDNVQSGHNTSGSGVWTNVVLSVNHPFGVWDRTNGVILHSGKYDQIVTNSYQRTNATYALVYAFEPDWGWLHERQKRLDAYRQAGKADNSREVVSETLNVMGLDWMIQTKTVEQMLAAQLGMLPQYHHRLGRMAQEENNGYYIDIYMQFTGVMSASGFDAANSDRRQKHIDLFSYFFSALESGIIEQLQSSNLIAASTVKLLQFANTNGQAIYLANSANWSTGFKVKNQIDPFYDDATLTAIATNIANGYQVFLPQHQTNQIAGAGSWAGYGYEARLATASTFSTKMIIGGGYLGGYTGTKILPNYSFVAKSGQVQPSAITLAPVGTANPTMADPVDSVDGTFQVEHTDLSLGQSEPRGITLSRYYNGTRRNINSAGMAAGWVHNYSISANTVAAPEAGLGETTPAQAAPMLTAVSAAIAVYNSSLASPKIWLVAALTAKWGVDQLDNNAVSVLLGKDTLQFIRQPGGAFMPPAGMTMTLTQTNSAYVLQERRGNTFKFDSSGLLTNIMDQYGQSLVVSNNTNNLVQKVTDWKGRSLTFNYTAGRLTNVTDSTGRSVFYGYNTTYNSQGDLVSVTDPESKTSTFIYDANHQIIAAIDAMGQTVSSNVYDGLGHVATQYSEGDPNKPWQISWSGTQTTEQDPNGNQRTFFYDDKFRLIGVQDALSNLTQLVYDNQNQIVTNISPLGEISQFLYDRNNNLTNTIDPLGFKYQFFYDAQNNLIRSVDERGNTNLFVYNAQFSLTALTNGAGNWIQFAYNGDGTLSNRTDSAGTTVYGYDSTYRQLNGIT